MFCFKTESIRKLSKKAGLNDIERFYRDHVAFFLHQFSNAKDVMS